MARKMFQYVIFGKTGRKRVLSTITARNLQDAINKAARIHPKGFLTVERKAKSGREFETTIVTGPGR